MLIWKVRNKDFFTRDREVAESVDCARTAAHPRRDPGDRLMAGDIILGYDGSEGSTAALRVAVTVAKAFDAPLTIVFGYEPNPMGGETADYKNQLEKIGKGHLDQAVAEARALDPTVRVEPIVAALRPVESLLEASLEREARVIVVGRERRAAPRGRDPRLGAAQAPAPLRRCPSSWSRLPRTDRLRTEPKGSIGSTVGVMGVGG